MSGVVASIFGGNGGCVGVLLTLPVFNYITVSWLHNLLIFILCFNLVAISRAFLQARGADMDVLIES